MKRLFAHVGGAFQPAVVDPHRFILKNRTLSGGSAGKFRPPAQHSIGTLLALLQEYQNSKSMPYTKISLSQQGGHHGGIHIWIFHGQSNHEWARAGGR